MSIAVPVVAVAFGSVAPPQGDIVELQLHLGCTSEVCSFEAVLQNWDGKYSPGGANAITVGLDGNISVGRGAACPLLMTCRIETIKYQSTPTENYLHVSGRCWGERLFRRVVTKTYTNAKGEDIINDLLDYYVGLSHVRDSVELVEDTDTTYAALSYEDTPVFDILQYIAQTADQNGVIGYDFRVAPDGKFEFFPQNTKPTAVALTDSIENSQFSQDVSRVRNKITVYGAADKSAPVDKDAWTESLAPSDGVWTALAGVVSLDNVNFAKGTGSIQAYAENLSYASSIFTLNTGCLVDAEAYPNLNLWLYQEATFSSNLSLILYDGTGKRATHELTLGTGKWFQVQLGVGSASADLWMVEAGFDWTQIWRLQIIGWFNGTATGSFWVDGLFFGGKRYSATLQDMASQASFGLREQVEVNEELWSDLECVGRAGALLANLKDPAESATLTSTVLDYGSTPVLAGDTIHVTLPNEGVDGDFRVLTVEYRVDGATQTLETSFEVGREAPLLADFVYALKAKTDSLSRYKVAKR
jgi:hypothetical protein